MHMQFIAGVAALSAALTLAPAPGTDDAQAVLEKAITAAGGKEQLNKFPAGRMNLKGTLKIGNETVEFTGQSTYQVPMKEHTRITAEVAGMKVELVQVVDGKQAQITANGDVQDVSAAQKQDLIESANLTTLYQLTPLLNSTKYQVKLLPEAPKVDGKETVGLLVTAKGMKDVKMYFDKKSNLLVRTDRESLDEEEHKVQEETYYRDYKKVQGIQTAMKLEVHHDGKKYMEAEISSMEYLEKADPKLFDLSR